MSCFPIFARYSSNDADVLSERQMQLDLLLEQSLETTDKIISKPILSRSTLDLEEQEQGRGGHLGL